MKNKKHPLFIFLKPMKKNLLKRRVRKEMHCIANWHKLAKFKDYG